ncbi:hypothetical protein BC829DRAFT_445129 [Chytridium lagenaria]|nr:hypothetical protein BC829DRAFT_445129 [Chytridium lagenaria]
MADLIKQCLDKLLVETSGSIHASTKSIKELREAITTAMEQLAHEKDRVLGKGGNPNTDISADDFWAPFRLAINPTLHPKIRETSLDSLQKLIAHKVLRGAIPGVEPNVGTFTTSSACGSGTPCCGEGNDECESGNIDGICGGGYERKPAAPTGSGGGEVGLQDFAGLDASSPVASKQGSETNLGSTSTHPSPDRRGSQSSRVSDTSPHQTFLIDDLVHTVCTAFTGSPLDDTVQLQVIKVLLTAITSTACEVHGVSLLKVIQTCFNIHVHSKSHINQVTAKASLTQMVNLIVSRMERYSEVLLRSGDLLNGAENIRMAAAGAALKTGAVVEAVEAVEAAVKGESSVNGVEAEVTPAEPVEVDGSSSTNETLEDSDSVALTKDVSFVSVGEPGVEPSVQPDSESIAPTETATLPDAFLVFRLLCRLSTQTDPSASTTTATFSVASVTAAAALPPSDDVSPTAVRARTLALELILSILNNAGPVLLNDELYAEVIRVHLCAGVSRNSVTTHPMLFELGLSIFLMLIRFYRHRLKTEVEICENPQTLVDLYVNYDCDLSAVSIFERIVSVCARVAQGKESTVAAPPMTLMGYAASAAGLDNKIELVRAQDRRLRLRGLVCLVAIVNSLVDWSAEVGPRGLLPTRPVHVSETPGTGNTPAASDPPNAAISPTAKHLDVAARSTNTSIEMSSVVVNNRKPLHSVTMQASLYSHSSSAQNSLDPLNTLSNSHSALPTLLGTSTRHPILLQPPQKKLQTHGFVEDTEEGVAKFLLRTQGLNKAAVGDFLGEGDAYHIRVMHSFVDQMDFAGIEFVAALRMFLQAFRLPGEAQKIDRLMEKFADRYCENNPGIFAKADTAYVLAFSVIMLNTDMYNPDIKDQNRMDKAGFVTNNRGINDNADLPEAFLAGIYDDIKRNEIVMEEEHAGRIARLAQGWGAGNISERQRMELYKKEVAHIQKKSQMLIKSAGMNRSAQPFRPASLPELARPMFASASWALMAAFSLLFESAVDDIEGDEVATEKRNVEEPKIYDLYGEGCFCDKFEQVNGLSHLAEMRPKNVKVVKTLIALANTLGEYLESSWVHILKIISLMERLQLIGKAGGVDPFASLAKRGSESSRRSTDGSSTASANSSGYSFFGSSSTLHPPQPYSIVHDRRASFRPSPALERLIADFASQTTMVAVDHVFSTTVGLSGPAIAHFFRALVQVALEEVGLDPGVMLTGLGAGSSSSSGGASPVVNLGAMQVKLDGPPRMYLLQKVVEIADYNMLRIRYEWSQIWRVLQPYFNTIGCHPHLGVSTFAVDALRQINFKFLEKEELEHFSTQNELLKSFEFIMKNNSDINIRELLLSSLSQMISARAGSIRSGWKSIFIVLAKTVQCKDTSDRLIEFAFSIAQMTFKEHFNVVSHAGGFVDYISCLTEFALIKGPPSQLHDDVVTGSIMLLEHCGKHLSELAEEEKKGLAPPTRAVASPGLNTPALPNSAATPTSSTISRIPIQPYILADGTVSEEHFVLKWFPILSSLSRVAIDSESLNVKTRALDALFATLQSASRFFDVRYWKNIHRSVLLPIFEDLKEQHRGQGEGGDEESSVGRVREGSAAVWIQGLRLLVDLVTEVFELVAGGDVGIVKDVFDLSVSMLKIRDEKLATSGQICLQQFIQKNIGKFGKANCWNLVTDAIEAAFRITSPSELLTCDYGSKNGSLPLSPSSPMTKTEVISATLSEVLNIGKDAAARIAVKTTLDTLDFEHTIVKCVTHIEVIQAVRDVALTELVDPSTSAAPSRRTSTANDNTAVPPGSVVSTTTNGVTLLEGSGRTRRTAITILPKEHRIRWLKCVRESYAVARSFNADYDLRYAIWRRGLVQQMPNLVKQETISLASHIRMLFAVYRVVGDSETSAVEALLDPAHPPTPAEKAVSDMSGVDVGAELIRHTLDVLERFGTFLQGGAGDAGQVGGQHSARDVALWGPVVVVIYQELLNMEGWWGVGGFGRRLSVASAADGEDGDGEGRPSCERLKRKLPVYFRLGIRMLNADRPEVRAVLQAFMERVADEIFGPMEATSV